MLKLILAIALPLAISFGCGYGVRDWVSRRRRKEARKRFYERYPKSQPEAHGPKIETTTVAIRGELTIRELCERLSRLENRIVDNTLEIAAFRDEARSEFVAIRELLQRNFEEPQAA
jgi:hypothetical protein